MSAASNQDAHALSGAADIETRAADWLQRWHFWDWSAEDQAAFEAWLSESPAHRVAYLRMKSGYEQSERLVALRTPGSEERETVRPQLFRMVASAVIVAMFAAASAIYIFGTNETVYATQIGGHKTVTLADGSQIELNTDTVLALNTSAGQRTATLEKGEAYFQIKHDAAHPFVVRTAQHHVTDLGTKFFVRSDAGRVEVALVEGLARLESDNAATQHREVLLRPGNVAVATADTMSVTTQTARNLVNQLGWRHGVLVFRNTTLADAAIALNRYNTDKLVVADRDAARLTINGTFGTHDVEFFARMAQTVFGLRVTGNASNTIISR